MPTVTNLIEQITTQLQNFGPIAGVLLILLESIIPALPLAVFIALNINAFGLVFGIILSWLSTCLGCYISFLIFSKVSDTFLEKYLKKKNIKKVINKMKTIDFANLTVILALPFTPAFAVNIAAGIVGMSKKKYLLALLIGKIFMVIFWGCVGKTLIESVTDITTIFIMAVLILIAYIISKIVSKKMNIE